MRIGFVSTRLAGTDGVSLEVEKWTRVLQRLGHAVFFAAGELGGYTSEGMRIPTLHFEHPAIQALNVRAFGPAADADGAALSRDIETMAGEMQEPLRLFVRSNQLDLLIIENAMAIPMNLPLGLSLTRLIEETGIRAIAHNHDFYWERERFQGSSISHLLDTCFPARLPSLRYVTINTIAQRRLRARRGIEAVVVPNVHDFATPAPGIDDYNRDFRQAIGVADDDWLILQPTRVIRRKGIEMAIELTSALTSALARNGCRLVITHSATDEGLAYWNWLQHEAGVMDVDLRLVDHLVHTTRQRVDGRKVYTLWDAYPHADLVTYPSTYEGFGNALLEAIYFKRPVVINRYPVYNADIKPLGFDFIELDGFVDERAVSQVSELLDNREMAQTMTAHNYALAREHFSLETLEQKLRDILAGF